MTEDEAKTKWCPFTRIAGIDGGNRGQTSGHDLPHAMCIGAACMAWRWKWDSGNEDRVEEHRKPSGQGHGYCGLAGKP